MSKRNPKSSSAGSLKNTESSSQDGGNDNGRVFFRPICEFGLLLVCSWIAMTTSHELGHVIAGWLSGAELVYVDIAPWKLPSSLHRPDPFPKITLWGGPVLGVLLPLLIAIVVRRPAVWFVADFCLMANGIYLTLAWLTGDGLLDTSRLLDAGERPILIAIFCIITTVVGYFRFRRDCIERLAIFKSESIG